MTDTQSSKQVSRLGRLADKARAASVTVLGFGISNRPLVTILASLGARVTVYDSREVAQLGEEAHP